MFSALFGRRKKRKKERKKVKDGRKERSRSAFRTCAFRWQKKRDRERKKEDRRSGNAFKALLDGIKGKEKEMKSKEKGEKRL